MGVLQRFSDIMAANINALLDKAEDPEKMIDQTLRNLREDLAEVKKETANVMANEKSAKRKFDEAAAEVAKYEQAAKKAVAAGNDGDARTLLAKKQQLSVTLGEYEKNRSGKNCIGERCTYCIRCYTRQFSDISLCLRLCKLGHKKPREG